ncbi:MAG: diguanylate cyclase [Actinomycetia bacterium]|nr:diguanylate cyclase [Actinomycetes bacterium]
MESLDARDRIAGGALLAAVSAAFGSAGGDVTLAAQTVCGLVAHAFGDAIVLRLGDDERNLQIVGVAASDADLSDDVIRTLEAGTVPMVAPLRVRGQLIGTLSLLCTEHADGHHEDDLQFLGEIADRCALDVDNARLLDLLTVELRARSLAERRHAALLRHATDVIAVVSRTGTVIDITAAVETVLGWKPEDLVETSLFDIVDLADRSLVAGQLLAATEQPGPTATTEFRVHHADGTTRWLEVTGNNLLDDPAVAALVITARDVTDRHQAGELLTVENRVLQQIAAEAPLQEIFDTLCLLVESRIQGCVASVWILEDVDRLMLRAAPTLDIQAIVGDRELVLSAGHIGLLDEDHPPVLVTEVGVSPEWEGWEDMAAAAGLAGSWSRAVCESNGVPLGSIVAFFGQMADPTDGQVQVIELATHLAGMAFTRDRAGREMAHAATHDALTGLSNRARFLDQLTRVLTRAGPSGEVAVLFVDLDDFKTVNDTSGHSVGDELLRQAGRRLTEVVRPMDLIARLGGDEFAVLCGGLGVAEAGAVARRVLEALDAPFLLDGRSFHVSASAGIAVGNADTTADTVLRDADTAMYQAKRDGRNRYAVFTPAVREATVRRSSLEQDLRRAIERCEISVHYQPVVGLVTGELVGLEALARWTSAEHGEVPPPEFIEVAERAGMIVALGACVLRQAVARAAVWRQAGLIGDDVTVAVNVAAQQLADPNFVSTVIDALEAVDLPCAALCLELTESAVMADVEGAQATLGLLRSLGITLAIDDFGTGHSSLARLRSLEVSVLKLDRMFILDLDVDEGSVEVVQSVVHLAHALGKQLVVEGVERPSQLLILRQLGADAVQGFHLARPQPAEAIEGFLRVNPRWDVAPR